MDVIADMLAIELLSLIITLSTRTCMCIVTSKLSTGRQAREAGQGGRQERQAREAGLRA